MKLFSWTEEAAEMSFTEHLEELRRRLLKMLAAAGLGLAASYACIDSIVPALLTTAGKLYYMRPAEAFFIYLKIGAAAGCLMASPFIFYQLWAFVMPAFSLRQRLWLSLLAVLSVIFFTGGLLFSYYLVFPLSWAFFTGFDSQGVQALISMENYVDFLLTMLLPFGFIFELPLLLFVGTALHFISSRSLRNCRPYVIFGSFALAAILTPPDVVSQLLLAVPLVMLYELSILFIRCLLE